MAKTWHIWLLLVNYGVTAQPIFFVKNFGSTNFSEIGTSCVVSENGSGSIYISGSIDIQNSNGVDILFMKVNNKGDSIFFKHFGDNLNNFAQASVSKLDNEIYIVGYTETINNGQDAFILKTDTLGNEIWYKTYGGNESEAFKDIKINAEGNLICVGNKTDAGGNINAYIVKLDSEGLVAWENSYGSDFTNTVGDGVTILSNNDIVIGVTTIGEEGNDYDKEIIKFNTNGDAIWNYIVEDHLNNGAQSITSNKFDEIIIFGETASETTAVFDYFITCVNQNGSFLWQKKYGSNKPDAAFYGTSDSLGNFYICGYNGTPSGDVDLGVLKLTRNGTIKEFKSYASPESDIGYFINMYNDSTLFVVGKYGGNSQNIFLIKANPKIDFPEDNNVGFIEKDTNEIEILTNQIEHKIILKNISNPAKYVISNLCGKIIDTGIITNNSISFDLESGIYFIGIECNEKKFINKFYILNK